MLYLRLSECLEYCIRHFQILFCAICNPVAVIYSIKVGEEHSSLGAKLKGD